MVFPPTTVTGTAVLEYGPTEILPQVGALSKHAERLCRPGRQAGRAHPRGKPGFWTFESGCGRETDSLLEETRFELSVPRVMDGDLGRQVPALIAVFELAGTAVALQRGTKVVRPDRHPEFGREIVQDFVGGDTLAMRL